MSRYVMDTDILSLLQQGHLNVVRRVNLIPLHDISISTISLLEQMQGWQAALAKARNHQQLALVHDRLVKRLLPTWCRFQAMPMAESALQRFDQLSALRLNVRAMDLRIAAIALENNLIVATR